MLMRIIVKRLLRRRASRSALMKLFAPKGGGIGCMFVSRAAFLASILNNSRQFASSRMGFVLILLITVRLGLTHTRLNGLRATNSSLPVVVLLSRLFLFLPLVFVCFCPVSIAGRARRVGDVFVWCSVLLSLLPLPLACR